MAESHNFGARAEDFAAKYLESRGYCILERNWRFNHKELDIICTDGKMLVVAEVKARMQTYFPDPVDLLSHTKERFIMDAAEHYLYLNKVTMPVRFDLLSVINYNAVFDIEHLQDAIIPGVE